MELSRARYSKEFLEQSVKFFKESGHGQQPIQEITEYIENFYIRQRKE